MVNDVYDTNDVYDANDANDVNGYSSSVPISNINILPVWRVFNVKAVKG